jgi:plasmid replication initiation protein
MNFLVDNLENFQTNSSVHCIETRNKDHFRRTIAKLSSFQKSAFYSGIRIFNSLTLTLINLKNERAKFKIALKRYLNTRSLYSVDEFVMCTDDL